MPPPTLYPVKKLIAITAEIAEAINEYRHQQRISSENEAIRRLIEAGLGAIGTRGGPRSSGSTSSGSGKPAATPAPRPRKPAAPTRKALPMSKEAQIRA